MQVPENGIAGLVADLRSLGTGWIVRLVVLCHYGPVMS
jgi:hypothetical protein